VNGPYESSQGAFEDARVLRGLLEAVNESGAGGERWRGARQRARVQYVRGVLEVAGVELGAYDKRIAEWVASWDLETIQAITGWIQRAHQNGSAR
jgi:hypothetical protein